MDCQKKATVKGSAKDRGGAAFVPHPQGEICKSCILHPCRRLKDREDASLQILGGCAPDGSIYK